MSGDWFRIEKLEKSFADIYNPELGSQRILLGDTYDWYDRDSDYSRRDEIVKWDWVKAEQPPDQPPSNVYRVVDGQVEKPDGVDW